MDELHATIAAFLSGECQGIGRTEVVARAFSCRFCGEPYTAGSDDFHLNELIAAGACPDCHRTRLRREARLGGATAPARPYTAEVVPHCLACGEPIVGADAPYALADMQLRRQCAAHYLRAARARR